MIITELSLYLHQECALFIKLPNTMTNEIMRVGIIGTGWIAEKAAITLNGLSECEAYAVGSRTLEKAEAFANKWNITKAYGSYSELIADPDVDLIYVGTPHSHHFDVTREALLAGNVLGKASGSLVGTRPAVHSCLGSHGPPSCFQQSDFRGPLASRHFGTLPVICGVPDSCQQT